MSHDPREVHNFNCLSLSVLIFPNSKEISIAYLQMSVDRYIFNDMRKILINIITIHMNVRCAEMMSSGKQRAIPPISTKRTITSHLKSLNISKNCLLS